LAATVVGAAGERLVLAGDSGHLVSLLSNVIPEFLCLMVVGGIAGVLISFGREQED
jgi:hypothetical protein